MTLLLPPVLSSRRPIFRKLNEWSKFNFVSVQFQRKTTPAIFEREESNLNGPLFAYLGFPQVVGFKSYCRVIFIEDRYFPLTFRITHPDMSRRPQHLTSKASLRSRVPELPLQSWNHSRFLPHPSLGFAEIDSGIISHCLVHLEWAPIGALASVEKEGNGIRPIWTGME